MKIGEVSPLTDHTQKRLNRINEKGLAVATRLAEHLAGKDVDLSELGDLSGLELTDMKEMRLRAFLERINNARRRLNTTAYGLCLACGAPFDNAILDETPWIEECSACQSASP